MNGKLKIREIADFTGLSISTVSRVLAGKSNTSEKARKLVMSYAQSQGILDNISSGRLLLNNLMIFAPARAFNVRTDIFYHEVIQGITRAIEKYDIRLRYCPIEEDNSNIALFLEKMADPQTEAALIIGIDDPHLHALAADLQKPCILINSYDKTMRLDCILPDHQSIGNYSVNYLFSQGHRKILALMSLRRSTLESQLAGIKYAHSANNIPFIEQQQLIVTSGFSAEESEQAITAYLTQTPRENYPTALLTGGDFMAAGAINALRKAGLRIPEDISVMSMDGCNLAAIHDIQLTAVRAPRNELGEEAIHRLQQRILRPKSPRCTLLLQGTLTARESVKRLTAREVKSAVSTQNHHLYSSE